MVPGVYGLDDPKGQINDSNNSGRSPREIQKDFPQYVALVADLKRVNEEFMEYADWLRDLAEGAQRTQGSNERN